MRFILIILISLSTYHAFGFEVLFPVRLKSDLNQAYLNHVIIKTYKKIGITAYINYIPEEEINLKIKSGEFDAIASKLSIESIIENSYKIEPPLIKNYSVSRWRLKTNTISLKKISIGAIKGVRAYEKAIIKNRSKFTKVIYYKSYEELFASLQKGTIDSVLLSSLAVNFSLSEKFKMDLYMIEDGLYRTSLNHYINLKHKILKQKLTLEFMKLEKKKSLDIMDYQKNIFQKRPQK